MSHRASLSQHNNRPQIGAFMKTILLLLTLTLSSTAFSMSTDEAFMVVTEAHRSEMQWHREATSSLVKYTSEGIVMKDARFRNFFARENEMLRQTNRELKELDRMVRMTSPDMFSFKDMDRYKGQLVQIQKKVTSIQATVERNRETMNTILDAGEIECGTLCRGIAQGKSEMLDQYNLVSEALDTISDRLAQDIESLLN